MIRPALASAALAMALSACASSPGRLTAAPVPERSVNAALPQVLAPAGFEGVIGAPAAALVQRFGLPRIDLAEGEARKLQFAGASCVVDIYLYPPALGAEPTAAHVDARLRQGGAAIDGGTCIREVEAQ